ncbi:MAG: hypothetical protein IKN65_00630 [Clostridia bacterium]|nr:hypothetical protein [Bacilli bacterium]MBR3672788.1 hypothetical protein [Clostridia bacterium]
MQKDEIKEILDYFRKYMSIGDCIRLSKIEDYITNLQEENERLKLELSGYREAILRNDELLGLQDYKFCCEKAIEYIKIGKTFDNKDVRKVVNKIQNDLLNILQGENKDE